MNTTTRRPFDPCTADMFTTGQCARVIGVSIQTMIREFDAGKLGGFRPGGMIRRIPRAEFVKYLRRLGLDHALKAMGEPTIVSSVTEPQPTE